MPELTEVAGTVEETTPQSAETITDTTIPSSPSNGEEKGTPSWGDTWNPDAWRDWFAGNDEKMRKHLNRFDSPLGIYKQWRYLDQRRNDGRLMPARPDTEDESQLAAWRKQVGAPDSPDGYLADLPAELNISEGDEAALKEVFATMHSEGIPTGQAKAVVAKYYEMVAKGLEERSAADRDIRARAEDELRSEWGPEYRQNLNAIGVLMESHGDTDLFNWMQEARGPDGARLGDNPKAIKFLAGIAREIHPDGFVTVTPGAGMTRSQAMADEMSQLETEMRDTKGRDPGGYWNSPQKQARYLELIQARERMQARGR